MNHRMGILVICILAVSLCFSLPLIAEETRKGIVVWRIEAKSGVSEKDIDSISGFITSEAEKYSGQKAVSDADIKTILQGEEKKQLCGASGTTCIAEIGSALGVPEAVSGDLGRMGDYWLLNLRRINVRTANVIARSGKQIKGDMNALIESIPEAVAELFGKVPDVPPKAIPEPEPVQPLEEAAKPSMSTLNKAAFGTFFSGVGLLALGGVAHWQMNQARLDEAAGDSGAKGRHSAWKGVAATGYAIGGALMVTGVTLWIVDAIGKKEDDGRMALSFGASPSENGFSTCLSGRW